jgi:hypothetical protein
VVPGLPIQKHPHRLWEATPEPERARLSKRNFYRFLDRWGDRQDLLTGPTDARRRPVRRRPAPPGAAPPAG